MGHRIQSRWLQKWTLCVSKDRKKRQKSSTNKKLANQSFVYLKGKRNMRAHCIPRILSLNKSCDQVFFSKIVIDEWNVDLILASLSKTKMDVQTLKKKVITKQMYYQHEHYCKNCFPTMILCLFKYWIVDEILELNSFCKTLLKFKLEIW